MGSLWSDEDLGGRTYVSRHGNKEREAFLKLQARRKSIDFLVTNRVSVHDRTKQPQMRSGEGFDFLMSIRKIIEDNPPWKLEINTSEGYGTWLEISLEELDVVISEYVRLVGKTNPPNNAYPSLRWE